VNIFSRKILKKFSFLIFCSVFYFTYFAANQQVYAADCTTNPETCGIGRVRTCTASGYTQTLQFNPTETGADVMFDLSNPVCIAVIASSYSLVKGSIAVMCATCGLNQYPDVTPSPIRDTYLLALGAAKAAGGNSACGVAVSTASSSLAGAMAALGIIYGVAKVVFDETSLCGASWVIADKDKYSISKPSRKAEVENWIENTPDATLGQTNYNEWYYDGEEFEDNPVSGDFCEDPSGNNVKSNGHYPRQKYYLRGTLAGNYNCSRYDSEQNGITIPADKKDDYKKAYACCKKRSQNYACIKYVTHNDLGGPLNEIAACFVNQGKMIAPLKASLSR